MVKSHGSERYGKGTFKYQVRIKKSNTSEPPFKCRNRLNGVKTAELMLLQDKSSGNLLTG